MMMMMMMNYCNKCKIVTTGNPCTLTQVTIVDDNKL